MGKGEKQQPIKDKKSKKADKKAEKISKSNKSSEKSKDKKPKDGSNKVKVLTQPQQKFSELLKTLSSFGKDVINSLASNFGNVQEAIDAFKFSPSQIRALSASVETEMEDLSSGMHKARTLVKRLQSLGRSPVLISYEPNGEYPGDKPKKYDLFKKLYEEEHPGASMEEKKKAWDKIKKDKDGKIEDEEGHREHELRCRVAGWDNTVRIYNQALAGKASTHVKKRIPQNKPPPHPVVPQKSETAITNMIKKANPDLSEEKLAKKIKKALEQEKTRFETEIKKAADILSMEVDELREGKAIASS